MIGGRSCYVTNAWDLMKELRRHAAGADALQRGWGQRALLVVAHPGHELRLFGWLCSARPDVLVLTDGSGHSGRSRIEATRDVLRLTGARVGPVFGGFTDRELYAALLQGDVAPFAQMTTALSAVLRHGEYRTVVADPLEGYNPTHDLCRVMVNTALRCVSRKSGTLIRNYEYALTGTVNVGGSSSSIVMRLPAKVRERKIAAAEGYLGLFEEVTAAVQREGSRAYDEEVLREITTKRVGYVPEEIPPFYETYGEQQCAARRYATVIRYTDHFLPMARAIAGSIGPDLDLTRYAATRSAAREEA
jgi:hypothetical protein